MKHSLIRLQVFYEISMSIGNSLDLNTMLRESLTAYLKKLNCSSGAVFKTEPQGSDTEHMVFTQVYSIPRSIKRNPVWPYALEHIPAELSPAEMEEFQGVLPIHGRHDGKAFYHIMELPGFGLLILTKSRVDLDMPVLHTLKDLNRKLAGACIACIRNQQVSLANEQLEKEIQFRQQMEEALLRAKKLEAIGILAGGLAHDFNNLLSVILGNLTLAKDEVNPGTSLDKQLNEIEQASLRARGISRKFITFSSGGAPLRKPLDLRSLIEDLAAIELSGSSVIYRCDFAPDLWQVKGDDGQLKQVFFSIIENALEAMTTGGDLDIVAENVELEPATADTLSLTPGRYVQISFRDQGAGIPEADLENVFDPYYSSKQRGTKKGVGFGLTIAYSVIGKHGGHIQVESQQGVGTDVTLYLPAVFIEAREQDRPVEVKTEPLAGGQKRVLVMDDEEMIAGLAKKMLERVGYEAEIAANGEEAVALYSKGINNATPFDAVLLDLNVKGGKSGDEVFKELEVIDPEVKAVVTSGYGDSPVVLSPQRHGFKAALVKPFKMGKLKDILAAILE